MAYGRRRSRGRVRVRRRFNRRPRRVVSRRRRVRPFRVGVRM